MNEDNGILATIPGQYLGEALKSLPHPDATADDQMVDIDVEHIGRVRLYIRRQKAVRGKHSHWFWSTWRAEAI